MIALFGKTYAKNEAEFVDSLFTPGATANGFYRVTRGGVYFSDMQGKERAFIRADGLGPVSVSKRADGKRWYMQSLSSLDDAFLGRDMSQYANQTTEARELAQSLCA
jgi:hypothetical protein